jgi:phage terminase large subunit-like protein
VTRGEKVIAFIHRFCRIPEGALVGKPVVLEPFQRKFILDVYDNPKITRRAYLSIARKNGKSALIGCILLAHIAGPEAVLNSQVVSGALSRDQAALVFNLMVKIINMSPELAERIRVVPSSKKLIGLGKNVEFKALSADGRTNQGLSPVVALIDEIGQVKGSSSPFVDAIVTAQGAHASPLLLAISTQAALDSDLFSIWIDDAKNDAQTVCHVYEAPKDADLMDETAWKAANPALGVFLSVDDIKKQAEMACRMPSFENTFRNLKLNQRVESTSPFISEKTWDENGGNAEDDAFYENPVYGGLDLSSRNDLTALVLVTFSGKWHIKSYFWTPEKGLKDRSDRDKAPYDVWSKKGLIKATPGASIDYEDVARDIMDITAGMNVHAIAFDQWRFDILKKELDRLGNELPFVPFGQSFKFMSPAIDLLESRFLNNQIQHGNNPVLRMCMHNCRIEKDSSGNRKLSKSKSTGRIDGMVAMAMAFGASSAEFEEQAAIDEWLSNPIVL